MASAVTDPPPLAAPRRTGRVLAVLQRIGRSLMMPIAVLPVAALLLRLGQDDLLGKDGAARNASWLLPVARTLEAAGDAILSGLPLLFAIGVAIGFARKSDGSTALAGAVGYLVFDGVLKGLATDPAKPVNPGVIGGITVGVTAALLYQRYHRIKLPSYLAFFGGRRFVPIVAALASVVLAVVFANIWPPIGRRLEDAGSWMVDNGALGAGVFGAANRALVPFGLHHIINSIAWTELGTYTDATGTVYKGDILRFLRGDPEAGTFMTGFFPVMMFGLPAAALAMWREARPEKRKLTGGIMISAALASFLTGITEPIEFAFLFVAPVLYVFHIVMTGVAMALMESLGAKDGFAFSAGATDFALNFGKATKPLLVIAVGLVYAAVYYLVFRFAIRRWNLMTPGREPDEPAGTLVGDPAGADQEAGAGQGGEGERGTSVALALHDISHSDVHESRRPR